MSSNYGSSYPAAPASGKYGGFGSEDMANFGYQPGKFNQAYDPYTKSSSIPTGPDDSSKPKKDKEEPKKHHKKKKDSDSEKESSSSDDDSDSDSGSDSEDDKKKKTS